MAKKNRSNAAWCSLHQRDAVADDRLALGVAVGRDVRRVQQLLVAQSTERAAFRVRSNHPLAEGDLVQPTAERRGHIRAPRLGISCAGADPPLSVGFEPPGLRECSSSRWLGESRLWGIQDKSCLVGGCVHAHPLAYRRLGEVFLDGCPDNFRNRDRMLTCERVSGNRKLPGHANTKDRTYRLADAKF